MEGCFTCDTTEGRVHVPGGLILATRHWVVDHCYGPLGVGTLIIKPKRHVLHVSELSEAEAAELGPLLQRSAAVVSDLTSPEQVYVCLWSHAGGVPVHIHFVVQPVMRAQMDAIGAHGPHLQVAMFAAGDEPPGDEVQSFAEQARAAFAD
jgi:diadenosine tetraphosphate (Ap4A) HIT family hydrolase